MDHSPVDGRGGWVDTSVGVGEPELAFADEVLLVIPPFSAYLRSVRLLASDTAVRGGLTYEDVEDFRLAVNELCHNLMSATDHEIVLSFASIDGIVMAKGTTRARVGCPEKLPELSAKIMRSLADSFQFEAKDGDLSFRVQLDRTTRLP